MSTTSSFKNYYAVLGVSENASLFEIESAYERLAAKWHPDKHKEHRKTAEAKFHDISKAFEILSDRNKRSHYDELLSKEYSLEDASATFDQFFNEHGIADETEEEFFNKHYPNPLNSYYAILGVPKTATLEDIKQAYRKLAIKYHPKNNPNDEEAHKKFVEVSEAYKALSNQIRRQNYDNIMFGEIAPLRAHTIFDDFFKTRLLNLDDDDFRPICHLKWNNDIDKIMLDEKDEKNLAEGQTIKSSSFWSSKNGQETSKKCTCKKIVKDGKVVEEKTEDALFPNGQRSITKTTIVDGKADTKVFNLKKGEELPKELTQ